MAQLETILRDASTAYISEKKHVAATQYKAALEYVIDNHMQDDVVDKDIIKYVLSLIALDSGKGDDIISAVSSLTMLETCMGDRFPAIYYALAKAYLKLFRFKLANNAIKKGIAFLNSDRELPKYYFPGTNTVLPESTKQGLLKVLMQLKEECSGWHRPDAICSSQNCQNCIQPHCDANRNIFYRDPTFTGMVRVTCNNFSNPCITNYHQVCWKTIKEQLSPIQKLSDKDVIGFNCFTPNCENIAVPSIIIKIEVIEENGEVKTVIEGPVALVQPLKPPPVAKGAIRKQSQQPKEKKRFEKPKKSLSTVPQQISQPKEHVEKDYNFLGNNIMALVALRGNNFGISTKYDWRPDRAMYGNSNLEELRDDLPDPDFSNSDPEIARIESFTFSMLYEYILNNGPIKVNDVLQKWEDTKNIMPTANNIINNDIEIIDFLLQSLKIALVGDYICTAKMLPQVYRMIKQNTSGCLKFAMESAIESEEIELEDDDVFNQIMQEETGESTQISQAPSTPVYHEKKLASKSKVAPAPKLVPPRMMKSAVFKKIIKKEKIKTPKGEEPTEEMLYQGIQGIYAQPDSYNQTDYNQIDYTREYAQSYESPIDYNQIDHYNQTEIKVEADILELKSEDMDQSLNSSISREAESINQGSQLVDNNIQAKHKVLIEEVRLTVKNFFAEFDKKIAVKKPVIGPEGDGSSKNDANIASVDSKRESNLSQEYFSEIFGKSDKMENEVYEKYTAYVTQLKAEMQNLSRQKTLAEQKVAQLMQEKGDIIKSFEADREKLMDKINIWSNIVAGTKNAELRYEVMQKDYIKLRQDMVAIMEKSRESQFKLEEVINEKDEMAKDFEAQYIALVTEMDKISKELDAKSIELEIEKEARLDLKQSSLQKSLNAQFIANNNLLTGYMQQCKVALEVFNAGNAFLKHALNINLFPEAQEWTKTLSNLQAIEKEHQAEFSNLFAILQSKKEVKSIENITLKLRDNPEKPTLPLAESIHRAFSIVHTHFMQMMPQIPNVQSQLPLLMHNVLGQQMFMQNAQQPPYLMNSAYSHPRNRLPYPLQQPIPAQPSTSSYNFVRQIPPSLSYNSNSKEPISVCSKISDQTEKNELSGSIRNSPEQLQDVSVDEIVIEEKEKLNEISSEEDTPTSISETPPLNGLQFKKPKYGIDRVMQKLRSEFFGVPELDLIESIMELRKIHNNSLTGLRTAEIVKETKQFILKRQRQHICNYSTENTQPEPREEKYENAEHVSRVKPAVESKDYFHPFAFERLSVTRNRKNSLSSTSSVGSVPKPESVKKAPPKPAWVPIKPSGNKWVKEAQEAECNICMDPLENTGFKKTVFTLRCQHSFHTECIRNWFRQSHSCPTCRVFATLDDEFPPLPS